jgi:hypothetical protein
LEPPVRHRACHRGTTADPRRPWRGAASAGAGHDRAATLTDDRGGPPLHGTGGDTASRRPSPHDGAIRQAAPARRG